MFGRVLPIETIGLAMNTPFSVEKCGKSAIWQVHQRTGNHDPSHQAQLDHPIDETVIIGEVARPKGTVVPAPDHTPPDLKLIFDEGAECLAIGAWNASSSNCRPNLERQDECRP
jgi:hypothetical protein